MEGLARIKELNTQAWDCQNSDLDRAIDLCREVLDLLREKTHKGEEARCLAVLGRCYFKKGDLARGLRYIRKGLASIPDEDYDYLRPWLYGSLSAVHWHLGEMDKARGYIDKQRHFAKILGDRVNEARALDNLGLIVYDKENTAPALEIFRGAQSLYRDLGDINGELHVMNNIVMCHLEQGEFQKAVETGKEAMALIDETCAKPLYYVALYDSLGLCYMEMEDYGKASDFFRQTMELMEVLGMAASRAVTLFHMGQLYHRQGETDSALFWMQEAMAMIKKHDHNRKLKECHLIMSELYEQKGDRDKALYHRRESERLTD